MKFIKLYLSKTKYFYIINETWNNEGWWARDIYTIFILHHAGTVLTCYTCALQDRRKVFSLLEDRYRPLGSRFIGREDLRRDIISRRSNSDEGLGEQIERRRRMEELTNRIDRGREARIRDIETQIRLEGRVSSESEEDPYGLENMFNLDTI